MGPTIVMAFLSFQVLRTSHLLLYNGYTLTRKSLSLVIEIHYILHSEQDLDVAVKAPVHR